MLKIKAQTDAETSKAIPFVLGILNKRFGKETETRITEKDLVPAVSFLLPALEFYVWLHVTTPHSLSLCLSPFSAGWCYVTTILPEYGCSVAPSGDSWSGRGLRKDHENGVNVSWDGDF